MIENRNRVESRPDMDPLIKEAHKGIDLLRAERKMRKKLAAEAAEENER